MYLLKVVVGSTSKRIPILILDANSSNRTGLTGLAFNTAGLTWTYWREDAGNVAGTAVTLATATKGTWSTGGFVEKDSSLLPGWYELGIPDAALASGANWVRMQIRGASGAVLADFVLQLIANPAITGAIQLDMTAGIAFTTTVAAVAPLTLAVSADVTPATQLAAVGSIALAVSSGITPAAQLAALSPITLATTVDAAVGSNAAQSVAIALGAAFDLSIRRFQNADLIVGVAMGLDILEHLGNETPGTFRPGATSGQAGIFRAVDAGDETPGVFRPASEIGTPGRFKPTS